MKIEAGPFKAEASEKDINALGTNAVTIGGLITLSCGAAGMLIGCSTGVCGTMMVCGGVGIATGSAWDICKKSRLSKLEKMYCTA